MKLKEFRVKSGMDQSELADMLKVSQTTISMWENNKTVPRTKNLLKIATALNCTIDELLAEKNDKLEGTNG